VGFCGGEGVGAGMTRMIWSWGFFGGVLGLSAFRALGSSLLSVGV